MGSFNKIELGDGRDYRDSDYDGIPDYLDTDDDGDGILTLLEVDLEAEDFESRLIDLDNDGIPNYLDKDDDGDGIQSIDEDRNLNGDPTDDDLDGDGLFDAYDSMIADCDEDGVKESSRKAKGKPKESHRKAKGKQTESQRKAKGKPKESQAKAKKKRQK